MLTRSANAIIYDDGGACAELRRAPDGRWMVATGISVLATGKSPWMPAARAFFPNGATAAQAFLAALPADPALHARVIEKMHGLESDTKCQVRGST